MIFDGNISGSGFTQVPGGLFCCWLRNMRAEAATSHKHVELHAAVLRSSLPEPIRVHVPLLLRHVCAGLRRPVRCLCSPLVLNGSSFNAYRCGCECFVSPEEAKLICDDVAAPAVFAAVKEDLEKFGGATFMSEGLACPDKAMEECRAVERMLDDHFISYTDYGNSQDEVWNPTDLQEKTWARVYARAIAGQPTNMTFSESAGACDSMAWPLLPCIVLSNICACHADNTCHACNVSLCRQLRRTLSCVSLQTRPLRSRQKFFWVPNSTTSTEQR